MPDQLTLTTRTGDLVVADRMPRARSPLDLLLAPRIVPAPMLAPTELFPAPAVDWRERLARNLGRPSTGRWEPLEIPTRAPAAWIGPDGHIYAHPSVAARLMAERYGATDG